MPFDSSGNYTPPTGAENAAPGVVIRSATWNSIFVDIASALTQLGQRAVATPRIANSGSFTVAATDALILVEASAPTITVPLAASKQGPVRIVGAAVSIFSSNNSVIVFSGGQNASGNSSFTLANDYQSIVLYPVTGGYVFW